MAGELERFREQNEAYAGWSDAELAVGLHRKFYSAVPMVDFLNRVGLDRGDVLYELRGEDDPYGSYLRDALATPGAGESESETAKRYGGAINNREVGDVEGAARAWLQGGALGWGDEIVAAGAAAADPLVNGASPADFWERFDAYANRERGQIQDFRESNPAAAFGAEIAGSIPTTLAAPFPAGRFGQLLVGGAEGAVYGAGAAEGDVTDRAIGAAAGAPLGVAGTYAGQLIGKGVSKLVTGAMNRRAASQAIKSAPTAAALRAGAKGHYDAAKATGAVIRQGSMRAMRTRARDLFQNEGLIFPSGKLAEGYPKLKNAWQSIVEYARGPVDIRQAQRIARMIRKAAASPDSDEARVAVQLLDEFETFMDALPQSAFMRGNGQQAVKEWTKAREGWAQFKRTQTIEDAIAKARTSQYGFAEGFRRQMAGVVNSPKKSRGFDQATKAAMRRVAEGAPIEDLMRFLQRGGALPAYMFGHVAGGGPVAGAASALAKMAGNAGLRSLSNRAARRAADVVRAQVAAPGGAYPAPAVPVPYTLPAAVGAGFANASAPDQRAALAGLMRRGG